MRNRFADVFFELAKEDERLCLLVADISPAGSIEQFRKTFPERFINTGVSEQIMVGMAAGMAQRGLRPFVYTIATFALYRPFEFLRNDICYQNLPITVVGIGGGVTYSTLGATHHAREDIAVVNTLSGMNVIAPCDPIQVEEATRWCAEQKVGPVYLRLGKAGEPLLTGELSKPWEFGRWQTIRTGNRLAIITYGTISKTASQVCDILEGDGVSVELIIASTIKPMDESVLTYIFKKFEFVAVIEEHIPFGSLANQVKIQAFDQNWSGSIEFFGLPANFVHVYGSHEELLEYCMLDAKTIAKRLINCLKGR